MGNTNLSSNYLLLHIEIYTRFTLECEVKWALGSITTKKASGGDGIPVELFHILKDEVLTTGMGKINTVNLSKKKYI